jgi:hypothetical protein
MEQVRVLREARGWTQQHLANAAGISLLALSATFGLDLLDDRPHVRFMRAGPEWLVEIDGLCRKDSQFLPGCRIAVWKDNFQVGCMTEVDSRTRTVTRPGLVLLDIPETELFSRVEVIEGIEGGHRILVDGEPWDGREHPVTLLYDAVTVHGPREVLDRAREEGIIPRHWLLVSTTG